ncbi:MAG: Methionyl-tRNA synthetase [Parcubacteria bacterium C7867-006]|nr:MAG: Methionyl-tRNA synthetase [Parcubacteria bacterium C7867-006]
MDNKIEHKPTITIDDFHKLEIKIGHILSAEKIPDADKLLKLSVDMGEEKPRQIVSGISAYFPEPEKLVGKKCAFAANLEPRVIRGLESQGMILAVSGVDGENNFFSLLETLDSVVPGSTVK